MSTVYNYSPDSSQIQQIIAVDDSQNESLYLNDEEIIGTYFFRERGSSLVSYKIGVIGVFFVFQQKSLRMHPGDNETYGDVAQRPPQAEAHLKNTQAYICHSPNGFLCDKVNYSCPHSRGNTSQRIVLLQSPAFYERL